jgi:SEC-C motif-containing protein
MRSRYCGYVLARADYLLRTWHQASRPATLAVDETSQTRWLGLKILRKEQGGPDDETGVVEFVARYKVNGKAQRLHETSRFIREGQQWFYVSGV